MTRNGVGKLNLQGIVVNVFPYSLETVGLMRQMVVILHHGIEESLLTVGGKRRRLSLEHVEHGSQLHLIVVIVREAQQEIGKTEAI